MFNDKTKKTIPSADSANPVGLTPSRTPNPCIIFKTPINKNTRAVSSRTIKSKPRLANPVNLLTGLPAFLPSPPFLVTDTVGFIRKLPTQLIESFKSTLNEITESDLLLHIVDISHPNYEDHIDSVNEILGQIDCSNKPFILVFNKIDKLKTIHLESRINQKQRNTYRTEKKLI